MNLALFDLDNTLLAIDSDHAWGRYLVAQGIVDSAEFDRRNDYFYERYKAGTLDIDEYLRFALAPLAGRPRAQIDAWHADFMARVIRPAMGARARDLVRAHLAAGDICCCVTATNAFVTAPIAREFGIPHLIACDLEERDGVYTGAPRGVPSFQEGKIVRVEGWLATMGRRIADFAESRFYSDSRNDIPLLERVTHPVAVDPDDTLREVAAARGWPVISLRETA
ncbi:MAG: HAD family hydrolase [Burkholderiales bacterium]|nr:HAD family hydrolase [Burkholderiales bacterium]